jgi:hypothetical protein
MQNIQRSIADIGGFIVKTGLSIKPIETLYPVDAKPYLAQARTDEKARLIDQGRGRAGADDAAILILPRGVYV